MPRSFLPHPFVLTPGMFYAGPVAGSDHNKSHTNPSSGISTGLFKSLIYLNSSKCGEIPPCMHKILSSIKAATGKSLKRSMN